LFYTLLGGVPSPFRSPVERNVSVEKRRRRDLLKISPLEPVVPALDVKESWTTRLHTREAANSRSGVELTKSDRKPASFDLINPQKSFIVLIA
jgi:hypothetical protein